MPFEFTDGYYSRLIRFAIAFIDEAGRIFPIICITFRRRDVCFLIDSSHALDASSSSGKGADLPPTPVATIHSPPLPLTQRSVRRSFADLR